MATLKMGLAPFLPTPWQFQAWLLRKVRMEKRERGRLSPLQSRPGPVCFLTIGLEQPAAAQRGQRWGWALNGSWGCIWHPKCCSFTTKDWLAG